jgi:hypothetical protein
MLFYVLAIPYRLTGARSDGLLLGALAVNGLSLFVIVRTLLRRGGVALAAGGIACFGFAMWTLGASWLWYPWNPNIVLLPFAAFVVLTWAVSMGSGRDLPFLAVVGSFLIQSHVAYGLAVVGLSACACFLLWQDRGHASEIGEAPAPIRRSVVATGIVIVLLWLPPVIDAVLRGGGNFRDLADFWLGGGDKSLGVVPALKLMALAFSTRAPWLGFSEPTKLFAGVVPLGVPVPIGFIFLVVATGIAARRKDRPALVLCLVVLLGIGLGIVSLSRIVGVPYTYLIYWTRILAAAGWLASAWALGRALPGRLGARSRKAGAAGAVVIMLVVAVLFGWSAARAGIGPREEQKLSAELASIVPRVATMLRHASGPVFVDAASKFYPGTFQPGLMLALEQRGIPVRTRLVDTLRFGSHYTVTHPRDGVRVVSSSADITAEEDSGGTMIAESSSPVAAPKGVPPKEQGEDDFEYLQRFRDLNPNPGLYERFLAYWDPTEPVAVFSYQPASSAPTGKEP